MSKNIKDPEIIVGLRPVELSAAELRCHELLHDIERLDDIVAEATRRHDEFYAAIRSILELKTIDDAEALRIIGNLVTSEGTK